VPGERVISELGEPAAQQNARVVNNAETPSPLLRLPSIHDLDIQDLSRVVHVNFQIQEPLFEIKRHAIPIDKNTLNGRRIRLIFSCQEASIALAGIG